MASYSLGQADIDYALRQNLEGAGNDWAGLAESLLWGCWRVDQSARQRLFNKGFARPFGKLAKVVVHFCSTGRWPIANGTNPSDKGRGTQTVTLKTKYALALRIEGPGVDPGTISVPDLVRVCQAAQDAVNRQAEAMRGGVSLRPGPKTSEVRDECTLELVGIEKGSTILPFRFAKPQLPLPWATTFGSDVIESVVVTVKKIGTAGKEYEFDAGVLDSLKTLGEVLDKGRISKVEWIVPADPGKRPIKAVFDKRVRKLVLQKIKAPSQRSESIEGILEMADFKEQERKCRIHLPVGQPIVCSFDEEQGDKIYQWLRRPVRATGMARINPNTGRIEELQIEKIDAVEPLLTGGRDFFTDHSMEELAEFQGVRPLKSPKAFSGGWPADQDVDAFLEEIYSSR